MMLKCLVIVATSLAVANGGGQITYADNSNYQGYNDATKVSYSSVSSQPSSVLSSYQQPYQPANYQHAAYNQYSSVQPTHNVQQSSQQYSQYPAGQFVGPRSYSSAGDVSYSFSTGPGYSTSTGNQQQRVSPGQQYQQQHYGSHQSSIRVQPIQQYSNVQQSAPIQQYSSSQLQAPQKTIQYFPALPNPSTTTTLGNYSPKNAHHYSSFATKSGNAYQTSSVNHQPTVHHSHSSYNSPNTVFSKPSSEIFPPVLRSPVQPTAAAPFTPRIIQSSPHFTHSVTSTGASSPSLAQNPIHIPSSPAPVAHINQYQQPISHHHRFSPSTAVSHAKFEGMGVRYEW